MIPRLLITGTGRSGTGYISRVLTVCGLVCGHEQYFSALGTRNPDIIADASWCALPLGLKDYQGIICHQVRHPLDVITSFVRTPITAHSAYASLHGRLLPDVDPDDLITYAVRSWIAYVTEAEKLAVKTWRLEDINQQLILEIGQLIDIPLNPDTVAYVLEAIPRNFNRHHRGPRMTWQEIVEHDPRLGDDLLTASRHFWSGLS